MEPNQAFTTAWLAYVREQIPLAAEAARCYLERYEYKSLWNTQEIQDRLHMMWESTQLETSISEQDAEAASYGAEEVDDPDRGKPLCHCPPICSTDLPRVDVKLGSVGSS